ncbi:histone deacetylase family protein [Desulfonatronovibrio magnus]|uniref:histone deacetylase family protein n=1 Tax=Desulfonatronovibrio magnus TaxID=698827 RepID=UPI0005EAE63F|nr:histone deacetylase family protein [Desulfonatronovibrio magnus]RQD68256.1 MAG: histone deacetylase family protein [Desulfonatronovibrio sp. MSAO_Bac4]
MFRIRRIYDDTLSRDKEILVRVREILKEQFPLITEKDSGLLPSQLKNPLKHRFRSILFVAEGSNGNLKGFAVLMHAPDLDFGYLDYISTAGKKTGGGIGGALYLRIREEAISLNMQGIFFECLPDDEKICTDKKIISQNRSRLKFYERFGARPITGTAYETPLTLKDDCPPYLVLDPLDREPVLGRDKVRLIVRAILERRYGHKCPPEYIDMVTESFRDDPIKLRKPKYTGKKFEKNQVRSIYVDKVIALCVNDKHEIHHVHERGYVQSPVRISSILDELNKTGLFEKINLVRHSKDHILAVHDKKLVTYLKNVCSGLKPGQSVYPYVFPVRNAARPPKELPVRAGYFCIDTFTPINSNAYLAARRAVDAALTAANSLLKGHRLAYALVRPPGHHAERKVFGGFCYFNSTAIAANYLSRHGKVAVIDVDYHHGNGTQDIFYERCDVLTISLHGQPRFTYPYFSGYSQEKGTGKGFGFNVNYPLPQDMDGHKYLSALERAVRKINRFKPAFLVIALGLDTAKGDPTGSWSLKASDFLNNGSLLASLTLPTLVVQEGGYKVRSLGVNARHFFQGLTTNH